jgi:hypothetical protein
MTRWKPPEPKRDPDAYARAAALLDGAPAPEPTKEVEPEAPPEKSARPDPHMPENRIERLRMIRDAIEKQILVLTLEGKGQAANALDTTLQRHQARLDKALEEEAREKVQDDPEAHREAIVAYVRELGEDDPLREELRAILCARPVE